MNRFLWLAVIVILTAAQPVISAGETERPNPCRVRTEYHDNLQVSFYNTACHQLAPHYWKNGVTENGAALMLKRLGVDPIGIITGGFNTNLPGLREPVDYVEIEGKIINGRGDFWPIIYKDRRGAATYLGIARGEVVDWKWEASRWRPVFKDLPPSRQWAIASGPWIKVKNENGKPEFTVQFFGNDSGGKPWVERIYRRHNSRLALVKTIDHKKTWSNEHRRIIFGWTTRRAILINTSGTQFAVVRGTLKDKAEGRADALAIGRLMIVLGYSQAMMMDGGSATLSSAMNPVYLVITKK